MCFFSNWILFGAVQLIVNISVGILVLFCFILLVISITKEKRILSVILATGLLPNLLFPHLSFLVVFICLLIHLLVC